MSLKNQNILERWFTAIGGASGQGEKVMTDFVARVDAAGIPSVSYDKKLLNVGLGNAMKNIFRGGGSQARHFIEIKNEAFVGLIIYVGVRDYGKQLLVSWYLVVDERELPRLARSMGMAASMMDLDIYKAEELSAFVSLVHGALKEAVQTAMKELNLDFTKVDTHTQGFLNIS